MHVHAAFSFFMPAQAATPASAPVPKPKEESLPASLLPSMLRNTYDLAAPNKVHVLLCYLSVIWHLAENVQRANRL
jgi:hypothetical protein